MRTDLAMLRLQRIVVRVLCWCMHYHARYHFLQEQKVRGIGNYFLVNVSQFRLRLDSDCLRWTFDLRCLTDSSSLQNLMQVESGHLRCGGFGWCEYIEAGLARMMRWVRLCGLAIISTAMTPLMSRVSWRVGEMISDQLDARRQTTMVMVSRRSIRTSHLPRRSDAYFCRASAVLRGTRRIDRWMRCVPTMTTTKTATTTTIRHHFEVEYPVPS